MMIPSPRLKAQPDTYIPGFSRREARDVGIGLSFQPGRGYHHYDEKEENNPETCSFSHYICFRYT
jgi:hypothetical protein